jgi:hypothetical protein
MLSIDQEFPLKVEVGFKKLFDSYRARMDSGNDILQDRFEKVLKLSEEHPILSNGIKTKAQLKKYMPEIEIILDDLFNPVLTGNEIKGVSFPYNETFFKTTQRYKDILADAGDDFSLELMNFSEQEYYIMGCSMILNFYYGYKADFRRPFYYRIPDKNGIFRSYRVMYNADFIEIIKTERSKEITQDDVDRLLENFDNFEAWKELFPPDSWIFRGFVIVNLFDCTMDVSVSEFKTNLLKEENDKANSYEDFVNIFRSLFNLNNIDIGFSNYNEEDNTFEKVTFNSYLLNGLTSQLSSETLCDHSHNILFDKHEIFTITNVDKYLQKEPENPLLKKLKGQNINSAIFASLLDKGKVLGILEIVSPDINSLNTINAQKLLDIIPFFIDFIVRKKKKMNSDLELIIQEECTSIHSSVHWKFRNEAMRYYRKLKDGGQPNFKEIVFEEVYPLFGQIDIKGSSEARNIATQKDLILQLEFVMNKLRRINEVYHLLIFEQLVFSIEEYLIELKDQLLVDSEQRVVQFLNKEILPLFRHLATKNDELSEIIGDHCTLEGTKSGFLYKHRKQYDDSVMLINRNMASVIDSHQVEAQNMYPHYYERFKTDGVEHNLYIGDSITKNNSFNKVYLFNLRLWQLQVMCEMENNFYSLKDDLPVPSMNVSSMILVFNSPLSLRFRMDEKRFDVDGTYNARYEVVKKRVDKSYIKGTNERVTQPGKIAIIYTHSEDEKEYLKYISFLQSKKKLADNVEILEIEDLQGVTGLKVIRVGVYYSMKKDPEKIYYTYEDLMKEIE